MKKNRKIRPLSEEEGGGWLIVYPDLPGCMSDGETVEEAVKNGLDAVESGFRRAGRPEGKSRFQGTWSAEDSVHVFL